MDDASGVVSIAPQAKSAPGRGRSGLVRMLDPTIEVVNDTKGRRLA